MKIKIGDLYFSLRKNRTASVIGFDRSTIFHKEDLVIPDNIEYKDHSYTINTIKSLAFKNTSSIRKIIIPKTVRIIEKFAFYNSELEEIVFLHNYSDELLIGYCCFKNNYNLKEINLQMSITSLREWTFKNCINLKKVVLPNTLLRIKYGAFWDCKNLEKIIIPKSVELIEEHAFIGCTKMIDNIYFRGIPPKFLGNSIFSRRKDEYANMIHIDLKYFIYFMDNPKFSKYLLCDEDGIHVEPAIYKLDTKTQTAIVIPKLDKNCLNNYKGVVCIRDKIIKNNIEYTVIGIEDFAFSGCSSLKKVLLPSSLKLGQLDIFDSGDCKIEYYEVPSEKDQDSYI